MGYRTLLVLKTTVPLIGIRLVILTGLFFLPLPSPGQPTEAPVSEPSALPQPEQPEVDKDENVPTGGASPLRTLPVLSLFALLGLLSLSTFALALYSVRLTRLRLRSSSGTVVNLSDSFDEWMQELEKHWKLSHQENSDSAANTLAQLQAFGASMDVKNQEQSKWLADAFNQHHQIVAKELNEMSGGLAQMKEILATVRKVAEEKKAELEQYKAGYRVSISKEALGHLCDVREHLLKVHALLEKNPNDAGIALEALSNIDWELSDTLDNFDLIEIQAKPNMPIRDESLSGKYKVLGTQNAPSPEYHGRIAEVIGRGYLIRIPKGDSEETLLFRPVQVTVFADPKSSRAEQSTAPATQETPTQPDTPQ